MNVSAVLFDLGHTLWDVDYYTEPAVYEEARPLLARAYGERTPDNEALRDAVGAVFVRETKAWLDGKLEQMSTEEIYRDGLASLGLALPDDDLRQMAEMSVAAGLRYTVDPETPRTLAALKERGLRLAAVSNTYQSRTSLRRSLEAHGLLAYLDALVISSELLLAKPHPAIFQAALDELEVAASESVFVGDVVWADVLGAQALGMKGVLTHQYRQEDPGESSPDLVIQRFAEVVDYVDRLRREDP